MTISGKHRVVSPKGQALVEFAIILPLLAILVFGITEFGRYLFLKNTATNGARQGARVAAVAKPWDAEHKAAIFSAATSLLRGKEATAIIEPPYNATVPSTGAAITVTVSLPFNSNVPNLLTMIPTSITAQATMRYE